MMMMMIGDCTSSQYMVWGSFDFDGGDFCWYRPRFVILA